MSSILKNDNVAFLKIQLGARILNFVFQFLAIIFLAKSYKILFCFSKLPKIISVKEHLLLNKVGLSIYVRLRDHIVTDHCF
jgi:hypothetical protein